MERTTDKREHSKKSKQAPVCEARYFQVFRVRDAWMALAKEEPFIGMNDPVGELGELWYAFGDSYEEALAQLKTELIQARIAFAEPVA
jgi:hypothetical protein